MGGTSPIIDVEMVKKRFGDVLALDGLTLTVRPSIFGLIGPNGAGKTTLLRILLGLIRPDEGCARVLGHDVSDKSRPFLSRIRVLHEKPYFPPQMTPAKYLEHIGRLYGIEINPLELLSEVDLSNAANRKIGKLSAGMHRRLGIAQALAGEPELVFLDEPTANLDVDGRDLVLRQIVQLYLKHGISFFICSHILSELERVCHRVAFIKNGKIRDEGPMDELIKRYTENRFKIFTSNPERLLQIIQGNLDSFVNGFIDGARSMIIEVGHNDIGLLRREIEKTIGSIDDITLYAIEPAWSLDDAYRRVISLE